MGLYEGFFGAKKRNGHSKTDAGHFQIRPFAQNTMDHEPVLPEPAPQSHPHPAPDRGFPGLVGAQPDNAPETWSDTWPGTWQDNWQELEPTVPPNPTAPAPVRSGDELVAHPQSVPQVASGDGSTQVWNAQYDRSLTNIQDHIHAIAGAVAMLDAVEHKMIAIKLELQRIRDANLMIDGNKVLTALEALSDYVNQAITSVDDQCVNMLRDAKLEIRLAAMDAQLGPGDGVALTMISIDRLLDYKIKAGLAEGLVAEETPEYVDDICAIVSSNIQILTSIMLALFASRDYTQAVTKLAAREKIIPTLERKSGEAIAHSTIDQLQLNDIDQQIDTRNDQFQAGRASLTELLKSVRQNRGELGASFN